MLDFQGGGKDKKFQVPLEYEILEIAMPILEIAMYDSAIILFSMVTGTYFSVLLKFCDT